MVICLHCGGVGYDDFVEDERTMYHRCYHCGGKGKISEEQNFIDKTWQVAIRLAYDKASREKTIANSDPDREGWGLMAAESGLTLYDYFHRIVDDYADQFMDQLMLKSRNELELLVAWDEWDNDPNNWQQEKAIESSPISHPVAEVWDEEESLVW